MVASDTYAEFLRTQLAPLGRVTIRWMFGKSGVFCDGVMSGGVMSELVHSRRCACCHFSSCHFGEG
jgi:DNA transformation protein and related proteins